MRDIFKLYDDSIQNTKMDKIIAIMIFLDMVLIGSDRIAVRVSGMTLRFVQLMLLATFVLIYLNKKFTLVDLAIFVPFLLANILSTVFSFALKTSVTYVIWTVFNYIVVYCLFFSWARGKKKEYVLNLWLLSFMIQSIYVLFQYVMGLFDINDIFFPMQVHLGIYRPAIWFYEPSYLATYFSAYLTISFYLYFNTGAPKFKYHAWVAFFCMLIISSTTGYLGIGISIIAAIVFSITTFKISKLKYMLIAFVGFGVILGSTYFTDPHMFNVFAGRLFHGAAPAPIRTPGEDDKTGELINKLNESGLGAASGGRVQGWLDTITVFKKHPIVGIGPNAYADYTGLGGPPSNVALEILANLGIIGFLTFSIFLLGVLFKGFRNTAREDYYGKAVLIALIVFCVVLQANQNYLRLYLWMQMGLLSGVCRKLKRG